MLYFSIEERCYVLHIQTEFGQNFTSRDPVGDNAHIPQIPEKERKKESFLEAVKCTFSAFSACSYFQEHASMSLIDTGKIISFHNCIFI